MVQRADSLFLKRFLHLYHQQSCTGAKICSKLLTRIAALWVVIFWLGLSSALEVIFNEMCYINLRFTLRTYFTLPLRYFTLLYLYGTLPYFTFTVLYLYGICFIILFFVFLLSYTVYIKYSIRTGVVCLDFGASSTAGGFYRRVVAEASKEIFTPVRIIRTRYGYIRQKLLCTFVIYNSWNYALDAAFKVK